MAEQLKRWWPACIVLIALGVAALVWRDYRRDYVVETNDDSRAIATVVSATFSKANALKVSTLKGTMQVTASDEGALPILRSGQVIKVPFSIDYFVDASRLTLDDYIYDPAAKTLTVRAPEVTVADPNIDESRRTLVRTQGMFVTRGASERLAQRNSVRARNLATRESRKPERIAQAQANARSALASLLSGPLAAAGLGDVRVEVAFPGDRTGAPGRNDEQWEYSRSIAEVLREAEAKR